MFSNLLPSEKYSHSLEHGASYRNKIKSYKPIGKEGFNNKPQEQSIDELKNEFDKTLSQYSSAYQQYIVDFIKHQNSPTVKYANSLVNTFTGEKYMINKFGYLRKFVSENAYRNRHSSCNGQDLLLDNSTISKIPVGINIVEKEVCGLEGQMIQDTQTKSISWVDEKGLRHSKPDTEPIPEGCPTVLVGVEHNNYLASGSAQVGSIFNKSSKCNTSALNDEIHPTLIALNDKLIDLSIKIINKIKTLRTSAESYDKNIENTEKIIQTHLQNLKLQKHKINKIIEETATLDATLDDNSMIVKSNSLKYLLMAGGVALVIGYLFKDVFSKGSNGNNASIVHH